MIQLTERPPTLLGSANGRTGRAILRALVARGIPVRALVRQPAQAEPLRALGAVEVVTGDYLDEESIEHAATGCSSAIYIGPPMHPAEYEMGVAFLEAIHRAGCSHLVYYSVLHTVCREIRHHRLKLEVEQAVVEGPMPFTILQPARYMQHLDALLREVRENGVHAMPFDVDVRFNVVDLEDVAEVVALAVDRPDLRHGTFELAGPEALSQRDMAAILANLLGRAVEARALPLPTMRQRALAAGANIDRVEQMEAMNGHYDRHGMRGCPWVLEALLGRPPNRFERYARRALGLA